MKASTSLLLEFLILPSYAFTYCFFHSANGGSMLDFAKGRYRRETLFFKGLPAR
jgi:hypothetical protein